MITAEQRARRSWMLSFADIVTLLIAFFVLIITANKGEVARVHLWIESQLETSKQEIQELITKNNLTGIVVNRDSQGVSITLNSPDAFETAKTEPSVALQDKLLILGQALPQIAIFQVKQRYPQIIDDAKKNGLNWLSEVVVEGHTDNDTIAINSRLHSNWELSALRALKVMQLLQIASQLPESNFAVAGMGEYHPISDNNTASGKAENRRITIHINASILKMQ
jgi:chemotaxis protein MotB